MKENLSIVYDMTARCPFECAICAMCATAGKEALKGELSYERKLSLMDELAELAQERNVRIDFSGGEIFTNPEENLEVIARASSILGRERVGISCSGIRIDDRWAARLAQIVSDCEMTMDTLPNVPYWPRHIGYAGAAAAAVPHLHAHGVPVGIQTVLTTLNTGTEDLRALYKWLCAAGVEEWSLLRYYPSGRGARWAEELPLSEEELQRVMKTIQALDHANTSAKKPRVNFSYTIPGHAKSSTECRCVRRSIGILPDGQVLGCFWAVDGSGKVLPEYLLGSVKDQTLAEILHGERARWWQAESRRCPLLCGGGCEDDEENAA